MSKLTKSEQDFEDGMFYAEFVVREQGIEAAAKTLERMQEGPFKSGFECELYHLERKGENDGQ